MIDTSSFDELTKKAMESFVFLKKNDYVSRKMNLIKPDEISLCDCVETDDGSKTCINNECVNFGTYQECLKGYCRAGDSCGNRSFQKRLYAKTMPFQTQFAGTGLKTLTDIKSGDFVMEYTGELISEDILIKRMKEFTKMGSCNFYFFGTQKGEYIDAYYKGNLARFVNHSCDPNCKSMKWNVGGEFCLGFFAKRDIREGEELTLDYQWEAHGDMDQKCYCGSAICRGSLTKTRKALDLESASEVESEDGYDMKDSVRDGGKDDGNITKLKKKIKRPRSASSSSSNNKTFFPQHLITPIVQVDAKERFCKYLTITNIPTFSSPDEVQIAGVYLFELFSKYGRLTLVPSNFVAPTIIAVKYNAEDRAYKAAKEFHRKKYASSSKMINVTLSNEEDYRKILESYDLSKLEYERSKIAQEQERADMARRAAEAMLMEEQRKRENEYEERRVREEEAANKHYAEFQRHISNPMMHTTAPLPPPPSIMRNNSTEELSESKMRLMNEFKKMIKTLKPKTEGVKEIRRWIYKNHKTNLIWIKCIEYLGDLVNDPVIQLPSKEGKTIRLGVFYLLSDVFLHPSIVDKYKYKWGPYISPLLESALKDHDNKHLNRVYKLVKKWESKKVLSAKDINGIKSTLQNFPNFKEMSLKEEVEERGKDSDDDEMMENNEEEDGEGPLVEIMKNENDNHRDRRERSLSPSMLKNERSRSRSREKERRETQ